MLDSLALFLCLAAYLAVVHAADQSRWIPARWEGGPAEVERRAKDKSVAADLSIREAIADWYSPATLGLLEGTPINCVLVTLGKSGTEQQALVREYARLARARGIAVLGIVRPGDDPVGVAAAAIDARLEGLVLEGGSPVEPLEAALRSRESSALVIPIAKEAASVRTSKAPLVAVEGVRPSSRHPMEDGIRATPSTEPWIESNIWLVRSFRLDAAWRPVWINQQPSGSQPDYYIRSVADAAMAGGRWIVALDDHLRAGLYRKDAGALATWRSMGAYLHFAEEHSEWRNWEPYGNVAIILDTAGEFPDISNEYLNLVARRRVPYRLLERARLSSGALAGFQAVLAADLAPPTASERSVLRAFAEKGGVVVAGPSWGNPPKDDSFAELRLGKGRIVVYKDDPPDPEALARDLLDLLQPEVIGLTTFNVPSVLAFANTTDSGRRVLVQLLNYASLPFDSRITIRFNGSFKTARLLTPGEPPAALATRPAGNGRTEVAIPKLGVWGAILLE